jgi:hypothetical protein
MSILEHTEMKIGCEEQCMDMYILLLYFGA